MVGYSMRNSPARLRTAVERVAQAPHIQFRLINGAKGRRSRAARVTIAPPLPIQGGSPGRAYLGSAISVRSRARAD